MSEQTKLGDGSYEHPNEDPIYLLRMAQIGMAANPFTPYRLSTEAYNNSQAHQPEIAGRAAASAQFFAMRLGLGFTAVAEWDRASQAAFDRTGYRATEIIHPERTNALTLAGRSLATLVLRHEIPVGLRQDVEARAKTRFSAATMSATLEVNAPDNTSYLPFTPNESRVALYRGMFEVMSPSGSHSRAAIIALGGIAKAVLSYPDKQLIKPEQTDLDIALQHGKFMLGQVLQHGRVLRYAVTGALERIPLIMKRRLAKAIELLG